MPGNNAQFQNMMTQGHSAAWDQEWEKAAQFYRKALEEFPDNVQGLTNLALALFENQKYSEALQYYEQAARQAPDDPIPLEKISQIQELGGNAQMASEFAHKVAELHLKNRDVDKAIENWTRSVHLTPENIRAHSRLAITYERLGKKAQAVHEYISVASILQSQQQQNKALELLQHAEKLIPNSREARQAIGLIRAGQRLPLPKTPGSSDKSPREEVQSVLPKPSRSSKDNPANPIVEARREAISDLAALMFDQPEASLGAGETGARRGIQSLLSRGTGPLSMAASEKSQIVLHISQVVDFQSRGKDEEAAEELEKAIDAGLDHPAAYFDIGMLKAQSGRLESALRNLQRSVQHPKYVLASRLLLGQVLVQMERIGDAAVQYLEALKHADAAILPPDKSDALKQAYDPIVEAYLQENDEKKHQQICQTVISLLIKDDWREKVRQARQQLPTSSSGMDMVTLAEVITEAQSSEVVQHMSNIHQMARTGHYKMAMEESFWALQFAPTYLPLHSFMAEMLFQQEQIQEAITKYNVVARAYTARGEAAKSIALYRKITDLAPLDLTARQRLIEQLMASGLFEETVLEYMNLGDVYYRLAELDKARETFQKALGVAQQSNLRTKWTVDVLHHLADIDMQRLDWRRALRIYEQIRGLNPKDDRSVVNVIDLNMRMGQQSQALSELGNHVEYLNNQGEIPKSIDILETLSQNNPDQIAIRQLLANQYEKAGMKDEAIEQLDTIGGLLEDVGDREGAINAVQSILRLNPENIEDYQQALQKLKSGL